MQAMELYDLYDIYRWYPKNNNKNYYFIIYLYFTSLQLKVKNYNPMKNDTK